MAEEQKNTLQDEQLEGVNGGVNQRIVATGYTHRGCGGVVRFVHEYGSGIWSELFGSTHSTVYECTKCDTRWIAYNDVPERFFDGTEKP